MVWSRGAEQVELLFQTMERCALICNRLVLGDMARWRWLIDRTVSIRPRNQFAALRINHFRMLPRINAMAPQSYPHSMTTIKPWCFCETSDPDTKRESTGVWDDEVSQLLILPFYGPAISVIHWSCQCCLGLPNKSITPTFLPFLLSMKCEDWRVIRIIKIENDNHRKWSLQHMHLKEVTVYK
jgi:hypothetical protein